MSSSHNEKNVIEGTTLRVYTYMVKIGEAVGPRDVMRGVGVSSPSVAYHHLQKLLELDLIEKKGNGDYIVKEKVSPSGFVWIWKILVPRLMLYSAFFLGILVIELYVLYIHLVVKEPIESALLPLILITSTAIVLFALEGFQCRKVSSQ